MKKFLLILFTFVLTANYVLCDTSSHNRYSSKNGPYINSGSTVNTRDKYAITKELNIAEDLGFDELEGLKNKEIYKEKLYNYEYYLEEGEEDL